MVRLALILLLLSSPALGAVCQTPCDVHNALLKLRPSAAGAQWTMVNDDFSTIVWNSTQTIPSQQEVTDTILATNVAERSDAVANLLNSRTERNKLIRAILMVILDENNNTRQWLADFKVEVAAATSLADLKTRVAALPNMPNRTATQFRNAVQNKINSGEVD